VAGAPARPQWLAVTLVLAAVVVVVGIFVLQKPGSINFSPTVFLCAGETRTMSIRLPSSVQATDELSFEIVPDGITDHLDPISSGFIQQQDGSWLLAASTSDTTVEECRLPVGSHTIRVLDSTGKVLAEGSFSRQ
jgi:hypothetical protein